ncbi:Patatin-like phospholipase [Venustampulla echinocandica]|uniref:Patatin-like phospholipase n=1 Tax=Venustampulla echinocandica TaxID=2656787 RepID=A0A370U2H6_9HELO|nr:Patatin-like phospholipase [Venustampulla echinocandica]RDL41982.1 Patatin-like phospholipase [Venustampulla echinocandica]
MIGILTAIWVIIVDVAFFWQRKFIHWLTRKKPTRLWFDILRDAKTYDEWEEAAFQLDVLLGNDLWRQNPTSKYYDYRLIYERLQSIIIAREEGDILQLVNLLRSGLVRNLGNICSPRLFNRAFAGTKLLIEDYITQVAQAIADVARLPTSPGADGNGIIAGFSSQVKLDLLHDTRQAFGRSTLVLQGGSIFGLCHLGVVKALFARGLLPRIITGTATGALIAALVGIHTEDELPKFLSGESIDLTAFAGKSSVQGSGWWATLRRRVGRFWNEGYFLDMNVLEECVRANVGDMTFEEAYNRTKRVLNITVATSGKSGVPDLLNYLTAPNVLIWSAAVASNASTPSLYGRTVTLRCKDISGAIVPWSAATDTTFRPWTHASYTDRDSPLTRIAELFNVNHFIVSQARPYLVPFLQSDMHGPSPVYHRQDRTSLNGGLIRLFTMEIHHRLQQLDSLGLLPLSIRRFLVDQHIPSASVTLVPEISVSDFVRLLETPTQASLHYWILRGERSVWPAVGALKVRCAVETELDRGYQIVRRRKAGGLRRRGSAVESANGKERTNERGRANSAGAK